MEHVVLKIRIPDSWIGGVSQNLSSPLKFVECVPYGEFGGRSLVEIRASEDNIQSIMDSIKCHPSVCGVSLSPVREGVLLGSVTLSKCAACQTIAGSDCFLVSAESGQDGFVEWNIITGGEGSLLGLVEKLEASGCEVKLKSITHIGKKQALTDRQEDILKAAFEMGYYDIPKKTTIKELARRFEISTSTLAEILQRGERKVIEHYFRSA